MTNLFFTRGSALIILAMIVASCGGSGTGDDLSLIKNSPDRALPGCTTLANSCNPTVLSGVMVQSGSKLIRFYTVTDNEDGTYTYSDGATEIVLSEAEVVAWRDNFEEPDGVDFETLAVGVGPHTDASVIPVGGTATYTGGGGYGSNFSGTNEGTSTLEVAFGANTVDLTLDFEPGGIIDRIVASDLLIDGYSFTGDDVTLYIGVNPVDLTGANSEAGVAGLFTGEIDSVSLVPIGFAAVGVVEGDDDALWFAASGEEDESSGIIPAD